VLVIPVHMMESWSRSNLLFAVTDILLRLLFSAIKYRTPRKVLGTTPAPTAREYKKLKKYFGKNNHRIWNRKTNLRLPYVTKDLMLYFSLF
jgi:hypothetical protein